MITLIRNLYKYRELLKTSVHKEVRGKYKGSVLGIVWSFLNPLLMVLVYSIVFPLILKVKQENYTVFLIVGLIPWTFFTSVISQGTTSILVNANLIKKVYFPREILPISVATSGLVNFLISCIIIFVFIFASGIHLTFNIIYLPLVIIIQYLLQMGIVLITSAVNIYFRDLEYIINVILMILFYMTPIVYNLDLIPVNYQWVFNLNPMTHLIGAYRDILFFGLVPKFDKLFILLLLCIIGLIISYNFFRKLERKFAELI